MLLARAKSVRLAAGAVAAAVRVVNTAAGAAVVAAAAAAVGAVATKQFVDFHSGVRQNRIPLFRASDD